MRWNLRRILFVVGILSLSLLLFNGCKKKPTFPTESRKALGTTVTITVYDAGQDQSKLAPVFDEAFKLMADWDKKVLKPGPDNQVMGLSKGSGEQSVQTDQQVFDLLMKALKLYDSGGKTFDIRYGPMLDAWGFDSKPHVPPKAQLDSLQALVTDGGMFVAGNSILLAKSGMRFDVRGMAEGYILDQVAAMLAGKGIRTAMIHTHTTWRTMGDAPDRRGFEVSIGNPLRPDSAWATAWVPVGGLALACAGQNRFESGGKYYHSILDPRTGMPADKCLGAVVQATDAATAQGMAYSVFVSGSADALPAAGKSAVTGSVVISSDGNSKKVTKQGSLATNFDAGK